MTLVEELCAFTETILRTQFTSGQIRDPHYQQSVRNIALAEMGTRTVRMPKAQANGIRVMFTPHLERMIQTACANLHFLKKAMLTLPSATGQ